jgi:beta-RFAP synthase
LPGKSSLTCFLDRDMPRVRTASRIHFGLLSLAAQPRRFGGVGLMVQHPGVDLTATLASEWSAAGPLAERALVFAHKLEESLRQESCRHLLSPLQITIRLASLEHIGLGTGTQLALAVGRAATLAWGLDLPLPELAARLGRGARSALGVHGFREGGLLVEAGKGREGALGPLVARLPFPRDWRVVLIHPPAPAGLHGAGERTAFEELALALTSSIDILCRLVLLGLLPAVAESDYESFGAALFEFNARVGELFVAAQGSVYAGPEVAAVVEFVRAQGIAGVGQSSWGPAVFAIAGDPDQATRLVQSLRGRFALADDRVWITSACNYGAVEENEGAA